MTGMSSLVRWWPLLAIAGAPGWALADGDPPSTPSSPEAHRLAQQARLAAQQGHCQAAMHDVARLEPIDPGLHAAIRTDPAIEACATRAAAAAAAARPDGPARTQATAALGKLSTGDRIRVELPTGRVVGNFFGATTGTLLVDVGGAAPTPIRLESMRALELSKGHGSRAIEGLKWGLLTGAAIGVLATLAVGRGGDEDDLWLEYTLVPPIAAGTLAGFAIGGLMSGERWEPVARW